ncbi:hypothetical protein AB0C44_07805 [Micromonospora taraxaci]|uniref:hypothetical protein n=1 Tax=Micromonospora taraxaci TaxID=1316803 RepID=UPI0033F8E79D
MKIFGREPTLVIQAISALLGVVVTFGIDGLSATQAAAIVAVLTAVTTAINATMVRPIAPAAFTGLVTAVAVLVAAYGLDVSQETVGAVQVAVVGVLALLTRNQVTPAADPRQSLR